VLQMRQDGFLIFESYIGCKLGFYAIETIKIERELV
jgi:hypothetical protein